MIFDNDLEVSAPPALPIIVAKWDKEVRAILVCHTWIGVRTHWFGGHTIACCGTDNCLACEAGQQWVKKFYIVGRSPGSGNLAILMLTPVAAQQTKKCLAKDASLLGTEVILGRGAARNTSPMTARVINHHDDVDDFGMHRLERCIRRIFKENGREKQD